MKVLHPQRWIFTHMQMWNKNNFQHSKFMYLQRVELPPFEEPGQALSSLAQVSWVLQEL